jgi:hypothetical protein
MSRRAARVPTQAGSGAHGLLSTACAAAGKAEKTSETEAPPIRFERTTNALGKRCRFSVSLEESGDISREVAAGVLPTYRWPS